MISPLPRTRRAAWISLALIAVIAVICAMPPGTVSAAGPDNLRKGKDGLGVSLPDYKPGEVIVVWKEGAPDGKRESLKSSAGVSGTLSVKENPQGNRRELLKVAPGKSEKAAVKELRRDTSVEAAGLNRLRKLDYTPSSPDFPNQWGYQNTGQTVNGTAGTFDADIDLTAAWDVEKGNTNPTTIAVIDSGVDLNHPNLSGRLWTNSAETVNGIDDDGNGYVDDRNGYNWAGISNYAVTNAYSFGKDSASQFVAQGFRAQGVNGQCKISGLEMYFYGKYGSPTQTVTYAIRGSLTGPDIVATNPISPSRIASSGASFVYEPFTSIASLTVGEDYFFVAYTSAVSSSNYFRIVDHVSSNDDYPHDSFVEGTEWWRDSGGTWTEYPDDDFYFKSNDYYYNRDNNGHGTHCCGIVGAADTGSGAAGVAPGDATRIMALKAGDSEGSLWSEDWMDAIDYASGFGADIISMSFGGTGSDEAEQAVINSACDNGAVLFASSGNSSNSTLQYPACYDNVISVGATTNTDAKASFSTYNSAVDLSAPGKDIYSTMPAYAVTLNEWYSQDYSLMSGTSMATPMAAGLGALVRSRNPGFTPYQVEVRMEQNADDLGTSGKDTSFGWGRINARETLVNGAALSWGYNSNGQLGNGTTNNSSSLVPVSGITSATAVSGGTYHSLARLADGTVRAWGYNEYGQLGNNSTTNSSTPVQVSGLTGVEEVAGGNHHSVAMKSGGTVWDWGDNFYGQLGNNSTTNSSTPVQVSGLTGIIAVAAGFDHNLALKSDGTVWAWGCNSYGQLGDGGTTSCAYPVRVKGPEGTGNLTDVVGIAAGYGHSLAVKRDGTVWAWGYNYFGQLGNNSTADSSTPVQVAGELSGVTMVAAGAQHSLALKSDGTVRAWGYNGSGQLGDNSTVNSSTPVQVSGLTGASIIDASNSSSMALVTYGTVWTWGSNTYGQLGNGTATSYPYPVQAGVQDAVGTAYGGLHGLCITDSLPAPITYELSPASVTTGGDTLTLNVYGAGFLTTSKVQWDGSNRDTAYASPVQLTASIPASDTAVAGTAEVTVFNPAPGGGTSNSQTFTINNPVPATSGLSPSSKTAGDAAFTLTVNGSNFVDGSVVRWNGTALDTTYASSTQLTASIDAADIESPGTAAITVYNPAPGGGTSNSQTFTINNPVPSISGLDPDHTAAGDGDFTLTVNGSDFVDGSVVRWNGDDRETKYHSSTRLDIELKASDVSIPGTAIVTVYNPGPGGGTSGDAIFNIYNPAAEISGLDPSEAVAGDPGLELHVHGKGFLKECIVKWNGAARITEYISPEEIKVGITGEDLAEGGTASVRVRNPDPCEGDSNALTFNINNPRPQINELKPDSALAGDDGFELIISGEGFATDCTVSWNGEELKREFKSSTELRAKIPASKLEKAGEVDINVANPEPGGGISEPALFTVEYPPPAITSITPSSGTSDGIVNITDLSGAGFRSGAVVKLKKTGEKDITAVNVKVVSSTKITCDLDLDGKPTGAWDLNVQNTDGKSTNLGGAFEVKAPPVEPPDNPDEPGQSTWYLAEGTTAWGFDTYISIENPNDEAVTVRTTYMTGDGPQPGGEAVMPAGSQATINPKEALGERDFSTRVECLDKKTIAVDRTMTWTGTGASSPEAHNSIGVISPADTWYLPEGSSNWNFETWLLIQNPNGVEAHCTVTYMTEADGPLSFEKTIPANSRRSFNMADDIGNKDASIKVESSVPVIPERAVYRNNRREGHDSIGTTTPALDYYLAEGTTAWGFTTYVLVQNPNDTKTTVTLTYMTASGANSQAPFTLGANSRKTVLVNDALPGSDFSTRVNADRPIIAERAMYWDNGTGEACHDSIGMDSAHMTFYLPDGQTSDGRETWTLVQNPNDSDVTVEISYLTQSGTGNKVFNETIPANSRRTFSMADRGVSGRAAVMVRSLTAGKPVMCERAMYWNNRGAGTDTIGGYSD